MAELREHPKHQGGYCKGERIHFYYIPAEHRVQYAKPMHGTDYVELIPKFELNNLVAGIKEAINPVDYE